MWSLRHPFRGAGRLASRVLRAVRASAPRAGGGGYRGVRPRQPDRSPRDGPGRARVRRATTAGAAGRGRDRPHALLDDRREQVGERAAAHPPRERADGRARPQREPRERRGAPCRADRGRRQARVRSRLRGDRRARRLRRCTARRGRGGRDASATGRLLRDGARRRHARGVPRPVRLPPADARPDRRRLGRCVRDVCARPRRRGRNP